MSSIKILLHVLSIAVITNYNLSDLKQHNLLPSNSETQ